MEKIPWILLALALTSFALWVVVGPWYPRSPFVISLVTAFFSVAPIGAFWMLYAAWYYFERVRPGKHLTRETAA